ncbi:hypothetical protein ACIBFB_03325 [Nocardiopsis sp. NPDC050513]|uniref:hypothetical protein n=1 Tax=Nocardiopsis sp. NPDC050513 TaxID=3364338 RepID=UPI0037986386
MAEIQLGTGEHPLTAQARARFPWAEGAPRHLRAELNEAVARAEAAKTSWTDAWRELDRLQSRLRDSERFDLPANPAAPGTRAALVREIDRLAWGADPERVSGFTNAGAMDWKERFRYRWGEGVDPLTVRTANAVQRMREGTERLDRVTKTVRALTERAKAHLPQRSGKSGAPSATADSAPGPENAVKSVVADGRGPRGAYRGTARSTVAARSRRTRQVRGGRSARS